jgi:hypothetical protein
MTEHDTRYGLIAALAVVIGLIIVVLAVTACRDSTLEDLPNKNQDIVQVDMTVYQAPDQFPNVVFFCNGTTGVYLTTRAQGQNMQLVSGDQRCHK